MKKVFLMLGILAFGIIMIAMTVRDGLISSGDLAIQSALEQNVEVSLNKNMDSSSRVLESGETYINIHSFEQDLIYAFINNANINIDIEDASFKIEYLVTQVTQGRVERFLPSEISDITITGQSLDFTPKRSISLEDFEIVKGTIVTVTLKGKDYRVRHIVDIRD